MTMLDPVQVVSTGVLLPDAISLAAGVTYEVPNDGRVWFLFTTTGGPYVTLGRRVGGDVILPIAPGDGYVVGLLDPAVYGDVIKLSVVAGPVSVRVVRLQPAYLGTAGAAIGGDSSGNGEAGTILIQDGDGPTHAVSQIKISGSLHNVIVTNGLATIFAPAFIDIRVLYGWNSSNVYSEDSYLGSSLSTNMNTFSIPGSLPGFSPLTVGYFWIWRADISGGVPGRVWFGAPSPTIPFEDAIDVTIEGTPGKLLISTDPQTVADWADVVVTLLS